MNNHEEQKKELLEFCNLHQRRPRQKSANKKERRLLSYVFKFCSKKSYHFDTEFREKIYKFKSAHPDPAAQKSEVKNFCLALQRKPKKTSEDKTERRLASLLSKFSSPSIKKHFDLDFKNEIALLCPKPYLTYKEQIKTFCQINQRRPKTRGEEKYERQLAFRLYQFCSPSLSIFDPDFKDWINETYPTNNHQSNKQKIKEFCLTYGRKPKYASAVKEERTLALKLRNYCSPKHFNYDPELKKWIMETFPKTHGFWKKCLVDLK